MNKQLIINKLKVLITPNCWLRNYRTDKEWDSELNKMLDNPIFTCRYTELEPFDIHINGVSIWICNYPYAFAYSYTPLKDICEKCLPRRSTVFRLKDALTKWQNNSKGYRMNRNGANT